MPQDALSRIRAEFGTGSGTGSGANGGGVGAGTDAGVSGAADAGRLPYITLPEGTRAQVSLFCYDNGAVGLYSYTADFCAPEWVYIHAPGNVKALMPIAHWEKTTGTPEVKPIEPLFAQESEQLFKVRIDPGNFAFYSSGLTKLAASS